MKTWHWAALGVGALLVLNKLGQNAFDRSMNLGVIKPMGNTTNYYPSENLGPESSQLQEKVIREVDVQNQTLKAEVIEQHDSGSQLVKYQESTGEQFYKFIPGEDATEDPIAPHEKVINLGDWQRVGVSDSWFHEGESTVYKPIVRWYNRITGQTYKGTGEQYLHSPEGLV